jgi:hypothetical protein
MADKTKYNVYRNLVKDLTDPNKKKEFGDFLSNLSLDNNELIEKLEPYYTKSSTYREFFQSIPKRNRCELLSPWLVPFMKYLLKDGFTDTDWIINIHDINRHKGGRRKTVKRLINSYPSNYKIIHYQEMHHL